MSSIAESRPLSKVILIRADFPVFIIKGTATKKAPCFSSFAMSEFSDNISILEGEGSTSKSSTYNSNAYMALAMMFSDSSDAEKQPGKPGNSTP